MSLKYVAVLVALAISFSIFATKRFWPSKYTETKVVEIETVRKDIKTVIKEVIRPDGSKETVTSIIDNSKENKSHTAIETKITAQSDWFLQAGVTTQFKNEKPDYILGLNRRVLGPVFVGVSYNTNGTVGANIGMEF